MVTSSTMTLEIDPSALSGALRTLARSLDRGQVASISLHYSPTVSRLSVCYIGPAGDIGDLPSLPGVREIEPRISEADEAGDSEADTEPMRGRNG